MILLRGKRACGENVDTNAASLDFTDEFQTAVSAIERRQNLFVTGKAGTGKSTLLRTLREISKLNIAITAPTGLAAVNVGGQTIHSFFRFPPRLINTDDIKASRQSTIYKKLDVLVIDEVSMVRADLMSGIDRSLRLNRDAPNKPFGGVCVVMFGDLHQLPPIVADAEIQRYLIHKYQGIYFFNSSAFSRKNFSSLELTKKFRQTDPVFSSLLDSVADRTISDYQLDALNGLVTKFDSLRERDKFVILAPDNNTVFNLNNNFLNSLRSTELVVEAEVRGQFDEGSFPTDATLKLKEGAKIVLLRNDASKRWVNGTIATISKINSGRVWVDVRGVSHEVEKVAWEKVAYEFDHEKGKMVQKVVGTFRQFPLRLAWALTIHKSQGMTLENVYLDLARGAFAHGQTYVALSRCRTLEGLALARPLLPADIIFDPAVNDYGKYFEPLPKYS